jgi:hypothetical protein
MHGTDTQDDDNATTTLDDTAPTPGPMSNCSQGGSWALPAYATRATPIPLNPTPQM